jgi:hypothetical protein
MGKGGKGKEKKGAVQVKVFLPYCPAFELCTKGQAHLGRCWSREEADAKLHNHLTKSPFHNLSPEDAREAIDSTPDCIAEHDEVWEEEPQETDDKWQQQQQYQHRGQKRALENQSSGSRGANAAAAAAVQELRAHSQEQLKAAYSFCKVL